MTTTNITPHIPLSSQINAALRNHTGNPQVPQDSLSELRLPRIDFSSLVKEQVEKARALKARVLAPPTLSERFITLVEGPWAPTAHDLPQRNKSRQHDASNEPYRIAPQSASDRRERGELRRIIKASQRIAPLNTWSSVYSYDVPIRGLHRDLHGFTMVHLSDIHLIKGFARPHHELNAIASFLAKRERPWDAILISGDIITKGPEDLCGEGLRALERIRATTSNAFMVYGNHDYHGHVPAFISQQLQDIGYHDINNQQVRLTIGRGALNIFGVDDAYFGSPAAPRQAPLQETNIILTHNLDSIRGDCCRNIDLILSGHTHWGEIRLFNGSKLMKLWGYCNDVNGHTKDWDVLTNRTLSYVHPGLARYYVRASALRHPPGIAIHRLIAT